jgi:hypothetical protein
VHPSGALFCHCRSSDPHAIEVSIPYISALLPSEQSRHQLIAGERYDERGEESAYPPRRILHRNRLEDPIQLIDELLVVPPVHRKRLGRGVPHVVGGERPELLGGERGEDLEGR